MLAAMAAWRRESCIGARHGARLARMDPPAAIEAAAHELSRLIFAMLTGGEDHVERGIEAERSKRKIEHLQRAARQLDFINTAAVPAPA